VQAAKPQGARDKNYFITLDGRELVAALEKRFDDHIERLEKSGQHKRMQRSWARYYAMDPNAGGRGADTTSVRAGGRQGENVLVMPNRHRGLAQRMLNMNAGTTPSWDCVALNTDSEASRQASIGDSAIEHYGSAHKLYERLLERDEYALVLSEGYIAAIWDPNRGPVHAYKEVPEFDANGDPIEDEVEEPQPVVGPDGQPMLDATGQPMMQVVTVSKPRTKQLPVRTGDFRFLVLSAYDCATESYSEDRDQPLWRVIRYYVNKWDLAKLHPNLADKIIEQDSCAKDRQKLGLTAGDSTDTDAIWVYEAYHRKSPACPDGRAVRFLRGFDEPLVAGPMPYKTIPVFRTAPGDVMLESGAHTPLFDSLQCSELYGAVLSSAVSNQNAHGAQNVRVSKNGGLETAKMGNVNVWKMDDNAKFEPIHFTSNIEESLALLDVLERNEDYTTGVNAAARGDAEAMKGDSGAKGALVLSAAQQMQTRFQRSRQLADSMLFTHIIDTLKTHATVERVIEISGKANTYNAITFKGSDLEGVSRVYVHPANPLKDTPEGRAQLVEGYLKLGVIETPEDLYMVATTGRLEHVEHEYTSQLTLIDQENELLADVTNTEDVPVLPDDPHDLHLAKHRVVPTSMALRRKPEALRRYMQHVLEHRKFKAKMQMLEQTTPDPQPPGKQAAAAAGGNAMSRGGAPTSQPDMPKAPRDPSTGKPANIIAPPELQAQLPA
jgi:hypothetical protein